MTILFEDDLLPVGKYAGKSLKEVIKIDPRYIKAFNADPRLAKQYAINDEAIKQAHESARSQITPGPRP